MMEFFGQLHKPMNMITDYIFAAFVLVWGHRLFWHWSNNFSKVTTKFWSLLFLFAGLGAITGGTYHGLETMLPPETATSLWKTTLVFLCISSFLLFLTVVKSFFHPRWQRILMVVGFMVFGAMLLLVTNDPQFTFIIYFYGPILMIALLLNYKMYEKYRKTSHKFASIGLFVMLVGSLLQYYKIGFSESFDHNDLYHMVSLLSFLFLYLGARYSKDYVG